MKIEQDNRIWNIKLILQSTKCPYLFYPANLYACQIRSEYNEKGIPCYSDIHCKMELCPFVLNDK
jgi:hypothetical protein